MVDEIDPIRRDLRVFPGALDAVRVTHALDAVRAVAAAAPFTRPIAPWGKPLSVRMTCAGAVGWVTDRDGYRYQETHPETGAPWPAIPEPILAIWTDFADSAIEPDSLLINHYGEGARMGLHRDDTEATMAAPVVSVSLGDGATFRVGGLSRKDPTWSFRLRSGDVVVLAGAARAAYHGVDRIRFGETRLLRDHPLFEGGGRLNLTLRRARPV